MSNNSMTHGEVREFVSSLLGPQCEMTDAEVNVFHRNCLIEMWTDLRDFRWYHEDWDIHLNPSQTMVELPADVDRIVRLWDPALCTDLEEVNPVCVAPTPDPPAVVEEDCDCDPGTDKWKRKLTERLSVVQATKPTGFWIDGGSGAYRLHFDPAPSTECTFRLSGFRKPSCTFWIDQMNDAGTEKERIWQEIDLPPDYHGIYAKCVVALAYAACDDPGMAQYWRSLAANEMKSLVDGGDSPGVKKSEMLTLGRGGLRKSSCPSSFACTPKLDDCGGLVQWPR